MFTGPGPAIVSEIFPTHVRAAGVSIGMGLANLAGGFTPMIVTWLIRLTGAPQDAGHLLSGFAVISLIGNLLIRKRSRS